MTRSAEKPTATAFVTKFVYSAAEIAEGFGAEKDSGAIPLILMPRRSWWHPFIIIPSGAYTLVQTAGRDVDYSKNGSGSAVWPSGFHWASPFFFRQTRISHVVSKQSFVFISDYSNVRTKDDVSVDLRMSATVRIMGDSDLGEDPQLVRNFVHKLGPAELTRQLQDALEEHVRFLARCVSHSDVYKLCALSKQDKLGLKETNIVLQTEGTRRTGISEVTVAPQGGDGSSGTVSSGGGSGNVLQGLDHSSQKMENELFGALPSLPSVGNYEEATLEDEKVSGDDSQNNDSGQSRAARIQRRASVDIEALQTQAGHTAAISALTAKGRRSTLVAMGKCLEEHLNDRKAHVRSERDRQHELNEKKLLKKRSRHVETTDHGHSAAENTSSQAVIHPRDPSPDLDDLMFHRRRASSSDSDETPVVAKSPTTQSRGVKRENSFELDRVRTPRGENEPPRTGLVNTNGIPMEATPSAGMPAGYVGHAKL